MIRGNITRRKIKSKHGFVAKTMKSIKNYGDPNYQNSRVLEIKDQLGDFNYEPKPSEDGVKRKKKALITLENGARYEGEWNEGTNKRDGRGH